MNSQLIQQGRAAYRAGDFSAAAQMLGAAKTPDEIMGEADHLRGNALMHLGMYAEAAEAYAAALNDGTYGKRGALLTNRGKALAAVGDYTTAAQAFSAAKKSSYVKPIECRAFGRAGAVGAPGAERTKMIRFPPSPSDHFAQGKAEAAAMFLRTSSSRT